MTCTQTPRRCGQFASAGDFDLTLIFWRPLRTSWLMVGILESFSNSRDAAEMRLRHFPDTLREGGD
jgi:hypothetical protein